jgi:rhodanese-related sulfurtransferase
LAVNNGYTKIYWMRTGMKGWMDAFLAIETDSKLLQDVMLANKSKPSSWVIGIEKAKTLRNPVFVDFRAEADFAKSHVDKAINIPYESLWSFANLEKLNKSKELVVIHNDPMIAGIIAVSFRLLEYKTFILK